MSTLPEETEANFFSSSTMQTERTEERWPSRVWMQLKWFVSHTYFLKKTH